MSSQTSEGSKLLLGERDPRFVSINEPIITNISLQNREMIVVNPYTETREYKWSYNCNRDKYVIDFSKSSLSYTMNFSGFNEVSEDDYGNDFLPYMVNQPVSLNYNPLALFKRLSVKFNNNGSSPTVTEYSNSYDIINTMYQNTTFSREEMDGSPEAFFTPGSSERCYTDLAKYPYYFQYDQTANNYYAPGSGPPPYAIGKIYGANPAVDTNWIVAGDSTMPATGVFTYGNNNYDEYDGKPTELLDLSGLTDERRPEFLSYDELRRRDRWLFFKKTLAEPKDDYQRGWTFNGSISRCIPLPFIDSIFNTKDFYTALNKLQIELTPKTASEYLIYPSTGLPADFANYSLSLSDVRLNLCLINISSTQRIMSFDKKITPSVYNKICKPYYSYVTDNYNNNSFSVNLPDIKRPTAVMLFFNPANLTGNTATKNNVEQFVANSVTKITCSVSSISLLDNNPLIVRNLDIDPNGKSNLYNMYKQLGEYSPFSSLGVQRTAPISYEDFLGLHHFDYPTTLSRYRGKKTIYTVPFFLDQYIKLNQLGGDDETYTIKLDVELDSTYSISGVYSAIVVGLDLITMNSDTGIVTKI